MAMFIAAAAVCGCAGGEGERPDYSDSTKALNMYAHVGPTDGKYNQIRSSIVKFSEDHRTVERYREYKECGFDTLLLLGNDAFNGDLGEYDGGALADNEWVSPFDGHKYRRDDFATSQLKKNLDMSQEVGLKVIVFDVIIHNLSQMEGGLIGEGKAFRDEAALDALVEELLSPYKDHPAFYGVTLRDEPHWVSLEAYGQVYSSLKRVMPEIYIPLSILGLNLDPALSQFFIGVYAGPHAGEFTNVTDAYEFYVDTALTEIDDFGVAYYPFIRNAATKERDLSSHGLYVMQYLTKKTAAKGGHITAIVQTFAADNTLLAEVNEAMVRYNTNAALAFGAENLVYFTYWMFPWKVAEEFTQGIMDDFGNKIIYDEVQRVNRELKSLAKVVLNFEYQKTYTAWQGLFGPKMAGRLEESELSGFTGLANFEVSGQALVNQMYDAAKDNYGFFVLNLNDPGMVKKETVTLTFDKKYSHAAVYNRGEVRYEKLKKSKLTLTFDEGDSAFVIPY